MTSNSDSGAALLATFCGYNYDMPITLEAKTGYLVVYFEGNIETCELAPLDLTVIALDSINQYC